MYDSNIKILEFKNTIICTFVIQLMYVFISLYYVSVFKQLWPLSMKPFFNEMINQGIQRYSWTIFIPFGSTKEDNHAKKYSYTCQQAGGLLGHNDIGNDTDGQSQTQIIATYISGVVKACLIAHRKHSRDFGVSLSVHLSTECWIRYPHQQKSMVTNQLRIFHMWCKDWRQEAISLINADLSSVGFCGTHFIPISQNRDISS